MLFDYIFLLKNNNLFFTDSPGKTRHFAIPLDKHALNHKAAFFEQLYNTGHKFCFIISAEIVKSKDKVLIEEFFHFLTTALFLPNYLKHNINYLVLLDDDFETVAEVDLYTNKMITELGRQGIKEIVIESMNSKFSSYEDFKTDRACVYNYGLNNYLNNVNQNGTLEQNSTILVAPELLYKKWVIPVQDEKDYTTKIKLVEHFESTFSASSPLAASILTTFNKLEKDSSVLLAEKDILKFKLENHIDYLKVLKGDAAWYIQEHGRLQAESQSSAQNGSAGSNGHGSYNHSLTQVQALEAKCKNIIDWYTKEYEILPKWYKRFGHLIKVFMGKRSFKSLFK